MDRIRELLGRLADLTAEELTELSGLIQSQAAEIDPKDPSDLTPEIVADLNELGTAADEVRTAVETRAAAHAENVSAAEAARQRIAAMNGEPEEEATEETETDEIPEAEAETETAQTPAPVAASGGSVRRIAARQSRVTPSPEAEEQDHPNRAVLTATGALRGDFRGRPITDRYELATAMADTLSRLPRAGAPQGDVLLASASWTYPEDRQLDKDDTTLNARRMDAVTHPSALVATGGICTPVNVDYSVPTWATAERPLRDGLPAFQADRGGIRFVQPPDITGLAAATGIWTAATDAAPGSATKPILQIACGSEIQVLVEAISTRLAFGNMQSRFAPEQVAANTDLAIAAAARVAENELLKQIAANSLAGVNSPVAIGATRDLITVIEQTLAGYRYLHRLPTTQVFTAIFPDWLKGIIKVDMAREIGHAQDAAWNSLMISDEQVNALLRDHGVNPIWHIDGQAAGGTAGGAYPLQGFVAPSANGAVPHFPTAVTWYLFPEGTIQFLDGGRLDLGVVRDATLDATNDYELFVEVFEGIAYRGFASGAYQMVSSLCASGGSAGTVSTVGVCA